MDWSSVASDFVYDGSLRDIYIFDVSMEDWQAVLDAVSSLDPRPRYFRDGEPVPLPASIRDIFAQREQATVSLQVAVTGINVHCYFFGEDEVEFDIDPREIAGPGAFEPLVGFMKLLAAATQKPVVLTHENAPSAVIMRIPAAFT